MSGISTTKNSRLNAVDPEKEIEPPMLEKSVTSSGLLVSASAIMRNPRREMGVTQPVALKDLRDQDFCLSQQ